MTKINRNVPCHCGSGKKYKKCCLKKDQQAVQTKKETARPNKVATKEPLIPEMSFTTPDDDPSEPPDPYLEAANDLWGKFQATNYEGQITLFQQTLEETPELIDGEMAFEVLSPIYHESIERDERDRFETLAEALHERLPDIYAAEAGYILGWRITNAIAGGRFDDIQAMANEMAQTAEKNIDEFFNLMDQLAYHNQLTALISATAIAWPQVKDSTKIFGSDEFASQATDYIVFNYLSQTPNPDSEDPALLEQIEPYMSLDLALFSKHIDRLTHQNNHPWTLDDFNFDPPADRSSFGWDDDEEIDEHRQNLHQLSNEFLGYLYLVEQVPYAKGALAHREIRRYILRRHDGELETEENLFDTGLKPKKRKKRKPAPPQKKHVLCPDRNTLDRFLADLLHFINPQYYKATTTLELIPAWLRFLESRQLLDAEQREQTLFELRGLDTEFLKVVKDYSDPALRVAMERWRNNAERE